MFEDDKIIHKATLILRELSDDEKLKEQARMRYFNNRGHRIGSMPIRKRPYASA